MSKQDRQKLSILLVLLGVLGLTLILVYRMNKPEVTAAVQGAPETKPPSKPSGNPPAPTDARIRLDLIEKSQNSSEEIGRKNVFQYGQTQPPVVPGSRGRSPVIPSQPTAPVASESLPVRPPAIIAPPGPPPIPFKYQGYATQDMPGGQMIAFLTDETSHHYNVAVGETLMGRYRITQISANSLEIEDTDNNRRQKLPLAK
jgi:hypothetical protein